MNCGRRNLFLLFLLLFFHDVVNGLRDRLLLACHIADVAQVKYLLSEYEAKIYHSGVVPVVIDRIESNHGRTSLLQCGFDPQSDNLEEIDTNCSTIAHMLSLHGANLSHVDNHGWNAVAIGAMKGMTKYTEFLLSRGVPIDFIDHQGRTPLMKAVVHGHLQTVKMLLKHGANISHVDHFGWSIFHFAVRQLGGNDFYLPILELLLSIASESSPSSSTTSSSSKTLKSSPNVLNLQDSDGRTPLMYAAAQDTQIAIDLLLKFGADPTVQDFNDMTAYQIASSPSMKQILALASAEWITKEHNKWMLEREKEMRRLQKGKKTEIDL